MQALVDQILPSFQSLGVWGYWVLAFFVFLQAFALTSALSPATVFVVFAGALAAHGVYDLGDMIWFVGIADTVGADLGYRLGGRSKTWMQDKRWYPWQQSLARSGRFFESFGGMALVFGRFVPLGAFVPLVAGIVAMPARKFMAWNIAGGFAYAIVLVLVGYFFGSTLDLVSATMTRVGVFFVAMLAALALLWFLAVRFRRAIPFLVSVAGSAARGIGENPEFRALAARYPRTFRFVAARFSPKRFSGLPSSLFLAGFVYFLTLFVGSTLGFVLNADVARIDIRIANLVFAFRDSRLVLGFTYVTALGAWQTVVILLIGVSCLLALSRRFWVVPVLWLVVVGNQMSVTILKLLFARPRPELAVYVENSFSFPSGHAAVSVAFFGFLTYFAARQKAAPAMVSLLLGASLIFLIGFSRIYLGEHYLSDVLNGYLIGALWAFGGIWYLEWRQSTALVSRSAGPGMTGLGVGLVTLALAGLTVATYEPTPANVAKTLPRKLGNSVEQAFSQGRIAGFSESLTGRRQQPISLILLAGSQQALISVFTRAGWNVAARPGFRSLRRAAFAAWFGQEYPAAPVTPSFWQGKPHVVAFERETSDASLRQRHHTRFWNSGYVTPDGKMIFVGTASFDDRLKGGITHHIDPNIDAERDLVEMSLGQIENIGKPRRFRLLAPTLGANMTGDPFFTDGLAIVLEVK